MPDTENTSADRIIGLGNQPNEEKKANKWNRKISKSAQKALADFKSGKNKKKW